MSKTTPKDLPWTGERYVPQVRGDIALEHLHRYAFASELTEGKRVLDIACGEGYGSEILSRNAKSVVGVDIDPTTVAHAIKKYQSPKMKFIEGACEKIPLPDKSVDLVVSFETLEHFEDHNHFIFEIQRVLAPGGLLVISTPEKSAYTDRSGHSNEFHKKELYQAEFSELLQGAFRYIAIFGQKIAYGSQLAATQGASSGFVTYDFAKMPENLLKIRGLNQAVYLVAVCSHHPLPAILDSLCEQAIWESEKMKSMLREKDAELAARIQEGRNEIALLRVKDRESNVRLQEVENFFIHLKAVEDSFSGKLLPKALVRLVALWKTASIALPSWILPNPTGRAKNKKVGFWKRLERSIRKRRKRWIGRIGFDRDWYLKEYPEVGPSGIDPLDHYAKFGIREGRHKSKRHKESNKKFLIPWSFDRIIFDSTWYLNRYPDVAAAGMDAYRHYKTQGFKEGRFKNKKQEKKHLEHLKSRTTRLCTLPSGCKTEVSASIAVHAHVFYIDLLDEVVAAIGSIPYAKTVFVSTTSPAHMDVIKDRMSKLPNVLAIHVRVVANRGRDIAPMLLEFGEALANADLVAHLHTKRSPHNFDLRGWRRYLFDAAFGSEAIVRAIVMRFINQPRIGLMFPATYLPVRPLMRVGANAEAVRHLLSRCGGSRGLAALREDFFPAGSVFWCRGSLIRRLVDLNLDAAEFEDESGQTDGTLSHALERILPAVASLDNQVTEEYVIEGRKDGESPDDHFPSKTDILVIDHDLGGGTWAFTNHMMAKLILEGHSVQRLIFSRMERCFVLLFADSSEGGVVRFGNLTDVREWYQKRPIAKMIVNSLVEFPSLENLVSMVEELKLLHGAALSYNIHDFYSACPSQHLLNYENKYCGVPANLAICSDCSRENFNMWSYRGSNFSITTWRQTFQRLLNICDEVVAFDSSSIDILGRVFSLPETRIRVRPHSRIVAFDPVCLKKPVRLHIGIIGTMNHYKGADLINELASYLDKSATDAALTLVGSSVVPLARRIKVLGAYDKDHLPEIVAAQKISVFFISSIAPETFCYTLDEVMAMQLPCVAFNLGAQGSRTSSYIHGLVLPAGCTIKEIYDGLVFAHAKFYKTI